MTGWVPKVLEFYEQGGWVMIALVVEAALLWYGLGYRFVTLRRGTLRPVRTLVAELDPRSGGKTPRARGVLGRAVETGLDVARRGSEGLRRRLDVAFSDHEREVMKYGVLVNAIVMIAPLTGLLGTVSGMIETFDSLADMSLFSQSGGIAGGIKEALFTTQMGLAVAIPGHIVGRVLARRQQKIETELDQIKDILCTRFGGEAA